MKFDILKWAYEAEFSPAIKGGPHSVLVALAYSANFKTEACFPSIERLVHLTRLKATAVKSGLNILKKEGLITVESGKGKRKSNRYTINYYKIEKKTKTNDDVRRQTSVASNTRQTSTDSVHENAPKGSHSEQSDSRNAATNKEIVNKEKSCCSYSLSSSNLISNSSDDDNENENNDNTSSSSSCEMKVTIDGEEFTLFLGKGRYKPIGLERATQIVDDWFKKKGEQKFGKRPDDADIESMTKILADAISMYTEPPMVDFADIENIIKTLKVSEDWYILEDTIENVMLQATTHPIENPRSYIMKAIEENMANGTADHV